VRDKITKGTYKFAPAQFAFDIKNGTLRLAPATLAGAGAETKIDGYIELASLKLDSEWAVSLAGSGSNDVPPVSLVFTGVLNKAAEISPAVDTAAIEAYLTMRRMQEGVEQLETLDVSGRTPPAVEAEPEDQTSAVPAEPEEPQPQEEAAPLPETAPAEVQKPTAETEIPGQAIPQAAPSAKAMPSATELLQEAEEKEPETVTPATSAISAPISAKPSTAAPSPPAAALEQKVPTPPSAANQPEAPVPSQEAVVTPVPPAPPAEATANPEAEATPAAVEVTPAPRPHAPSRPRRQRPAAPQEAPDAWRKGISIFGGG
jgi:hypothetical protein